MECDWKDKRKSFGRSRYVAQLERGRAEQQQRRRELPAARLVQ